MKRPAMNIALGTIFGAAVAGIIAVALAGRSWLWFGIAIGAGGGWVIAKWEHFYWAYQRRRVRSASSSGAEVGTQRAERDRRSDV